MAEWLASVAEVSNLVSFLSVILSFTAMFFFLVRLIGEDMFEGGGGGVIKMTHAPPRINLSKIRLPCRIKFIGVKEPLSIQLSVTTLCEGNLRAYWGVHIHSFHQVLRAPKDWFITAFKHGNLFGQDKCLEFGPMETIQKMEEELISVVKPTTSPFHLGLAPREVFPCVVVLLCGESAVLTAIHIRDAQCSVPSQILEEYYKEGGTSTLLKPLFIATADQGESSDTESQDETESQEILDSGCGLGRCSICQLYRINTAILPCRHAASCTYCFSRLQSCPICRGYIQSYFLLGPEPSPNQQQQQPATVTQSRGWREMFRVWMRGPLVMQDQN